MYFTPFLTVVLFQGSKDWDYVFALGLFTSLMNDLFYGWIGSYLTGKQLKSTASRSTFSPTMSVSSGCEV
jgi:hypothetical protein